MQPWKYWIALGTLLGLTFTLMGCGENTPPDITITEPLTTEIHFNIPILAQAPQGVKISQVTVTVTAGPNDNQILATAPLTVNNGVATGKVTVLAGKSRVFTLTVYDEEGTEIGSGKTTADVIAGQTVTVNIDVTITPPTGEVVVNGKIPEVEPLEVDIIPGSKIAGVKLGDTFGTVKKLYGKPDSVDDNSGVFFYQSPPLVGAIDDLNRNNVVDDNEPVYLLLALAPYDGKTAGGNGIGSTMTDVQREFGRPNKIDGPDKNNEMTHQYPNLGIDFIYNAGTQRVVSIGIYEGGPAAAPPIAPHAG